MNTYTFALKHDKGYINIKVKAKNYKTAKDMLCKIENCPPRALTLMCIDDVMPKRKSQNEM